MAAHRAVIKAKIVQVGPLAVEDDQYVSANGRWRINDCLRLRFRFGRIDHKGRNRKRWGDKAGNVDEPVEAENESDLVCDWIVKGKQESDDRYAVVARSRKIQSNGGPSNGPASRCRHARRLALVRAVLRAPRPRGAGCGGNFCALRTLLSPIVKRSIVPTGLSAGTSGARPSSSLRVRFFSTFAVTPIR